MTLSVIFAGVPTVPLNAVGDAGVATPAAVVAIGLMLPVRPVVLKENVVGELALPSVVFCTLTVGTLLLLKRQV